MLGGCCKRLVGAVSFSVRSWWSGLPGRWARGAWLWEKVKKHLAGAFDVCEMSFLVQVSTLVVSGGSGEADGPPERRFLNISSWERSEKYSESQEVSAEKASIQLVQSSCKQLLLHRQKWLRLVQTQTAEKGNARTAMLETDGWD